MTIMTLAHGEEELLALTGRLNRHIEEMGEIAWGLRRLSGFEAVGEVLIREQEALLEERSSMKDLARALRNAWEAYAECEGRILWFGENDRNNRNNR